MKFEFWAATFAVALVLGPAAAQSAPTRPPIEAFGTLPVLSDPSLSPDGKYLATIEVYEGRPVATIRRLDALGAAPIALPFDDGFIVRVQWAKNNRLLVTVNTNKRYTEVVMGYEFKDDVKPWYRTFAVDPDGKNPVMMFKNQDGARYNYSVSTILDLAPEDPDHIYMPLWTPVGNYITSSIFQVDVGTGKAQPILRGESTTRHWVMDGHGHVVARIDRTTSPFVDHLMLRTVKEDWEEAESAPLPDGLEIHGLTQDGSALVMTAVDVKTGLAGLVTRSLTDGKKTPLFADQKFDVDGTLNDPWTGRIIGAVFTADQTKVIYFDPKFEALQRGLEHTFPGKDVVAVTWDISQQKVIAAVGGPRTPRAYFLLDRSTHQAVLLGSAYDSLHAADLGVVKPYPYTARDGLEIPAYLTLPPGKLARNLPVVILPHGGPMGRNDMDFDWESQFLANRGYAVLQPNFRGSSGYGKKFEEAGYGQWGLKMQDDITDGVKKLIADGIADPKRVCIVGASYGGYAALAGAALTPDVYACAAAWAPVTDLREFLSTRAHEYGSDSAMIESWQRFIGDRWNDSAKLDAASPAENVDKIRISVLLMHGEADATVRINQSEIMDAALRRAGKKVTFVRIPKETHYMQASDSRIRWLTELEKFLKENIGD